mmetsp:Transcript_13404/g.25358  ORF Transcript_13404/g.25358 Transcript_13404/m.25358 type:complete len:245 (+) Transcript_13404:1815-2549(+)
MTKCITWQFLTSGFHLFDNVVNSSSLADEDVHNAKGSHYLFESGCLSLNVDWDLRDEDRMHVKLFHMEVQVRDAGQSLEVITIHPGSGSSEVATTASHHFMNDQHAWVGALLIHHIGKEFGTFFGCCVSTKSLLDWVYIIVDGFWEANDCEVVVVLLEECRQICSCCVGIISTDCVQHVYTILHKLVGSYLLRILALFRQSPLHAILHIGELDTAVANGASTVQMQDTSTFPTALSDLHTVTLE